MAWQRYNLHAITSTYSWQGINTGRLVVCPLLPVVPPAGPTHGHATLSEMETESECIWLAELHSLLILSCSARVLSVYFLKVCLLLCLCQLYKLTQNKTELPPPPPPHHHHLEESVLQKPTTYPTSSSPTTWKVSAEWAQGGH